MRKRHQHYASCFRRASRSFWHKERSDEVRSLASDTKQVGIMQELGMASWMLVPMVTRGRLLGALTLVVKINEPYQEADLELATDLASRAAMAIENARLYEEARSANQTKSELLAVISHDFHTPLNSIIGYAQLLRWEYLMYCRRNRPSASIAFRLQHSISST